MAAIFVVKIDGKTAAMTNTFDSAASYAEQLRGEGHRITIRSLRPQDMEPAIRALMRWERAVGVTGETASYGRHKPSRATPERNGAPRWPSGS